MTPPSPALCGVFRFYLRTSLLHAYPVSRSYCLFFSKPPDFVNLVQLFNRPSGKGFRAVWGEFVLVYFLGSKGMRTRITGNGKSTSGTGQRVWACFSADAGLGCDATYFRVRPSAATRDSSPIAAIQPGNSSMTEARDDQPGRR